jgi:hypothetical protein
MTNVVAIERVKSRPGVIEHPIWSARGYVLGNPEHGKQKHHAIYEVCVKTLDEAATLVERGYSLRMGARGKRDSLICPAGLRIVRV